MSKAKRYQNAAILFGLILILASCSIQKRRYRPGFYVKTSKNYSKSTTPEETTDNSYTPDDEGGLKAEEGPATINQDVKDPAPINQDLADNSFDSYEVTTSTNEDIVESHSDELMEESAILPNELNNQTTAEKDKTEEAMETNKEKKQISKRTIAIIIGLSLLLMAIIAGFSATTIGNIFVVGNPAQTAFNLSANWGGFIGAIIGWVGIFILDILVSIGVIKYYKKERPKLSRASGILRLIYTLVLGGAIAQLFAVSLNSSALQIYNLISAFNSIWGWGLIVFGVHLILLGIMYHNEGGRKWFNILIKALLIMAGVGYMLQYIGILVVANPIVFAATVESIFLVSMILGEVLFAIWMLIKGGKG